MDDQLPADLPRYVFRRANGSFRYKRNVPLKLRALFGKDTLYRRLGDSYREAIQNLPLVHARVEALFAGEAEKSARMRSLELIRGALGDEVADMVLAGAVPEYSDIEDALNEFGKELHRKNLPTGFLPKHPSNSCIFQGKRRNRFVSVRTHLCVASEIECSQNLLKLGAFQ